MTEALFDRLLGLVGRRADDPELQAFHREQGLDPPPQAFPGLYSSQKFGSKQNGYSFTYEGHLRRPETWPPRLVEGKLIPYLTRIGLKRGSAACPPDLPVELEEDEAKARAVSHREEEMHNIYCLVDRAGRRLEASFFKPAGKRASLNLLAEAWGFGDPPPVPGLSRDEQERLESEARIAAAGWDPTPLSNRCARAFPARHGVPATDPLPPSLAELHALMHRGRVGELDFSMHPRREVGGPTAWTNNPEAEPEFFVFGYDGRGSEVAFWLLDDGPLEQQPVVFLGSEGDGDVWEISKDLPDFFELLASGVDPCARFTTCAPVPGAREILDRHFPGRSPRTVEEIRKGAKPFKDIHHRMMYQLNRHT